MTVIGHHYDVHVCQTCREQLSWDADGNVDPCPYCPGYQDPVVISVFVTDVQVRLKVREARDRSERA